MGPMRAWVRLMLAAAACAMAANWGSLRPLAGPEDVAGVVVPEAVPLLTRVLAGRGPPPAAPTAPLASPASYGGCTACQSPAPGLRSDGLATLPQRAASQDDLPAVSAVETKAVPAVAAANTTGPAEPERRLSAAEVQAARRPVGSSSLPQDQKMVDIGLLPPFSPRRMHLRQPAVRRNCSAHVSIWPSNVGFGHVQQNRNAAHLAAHFAARRGADVCYAFPFSHATRHKGDGGQGSAWDRVLRFDAAFDTLDAVAARPGARTVHLGWRKSHLWPSDALRREVDRDLAHPANGTVYLLPPDSELQDNCWPMGPMLRSAFDRHSEPRSLRFKPTCYSVALHVRRGDSLKKNKKARYVGLSYFMAVADLLTAVAGSQQLCFYLFSDSSDTSEFQPFVQRWPNATTLCTDVGAVDTFHHLIKADVLVASKSGLSYIAATMAVGLVLFPSSFWRFTKCDDFWVQTTVQSEAEGLLNRTQLEVLWQWYARYHPARGLTYVDLPAIPQTPAPPAPGRPPSVAVHFEGVGGVRAEVDLAADALLLPSQVWKRLSTRGGLLAQLYNAMDPPPTPDCDFPAWVAGGCGVAPRRASVPALLAVAVSLTPPPASAPAPTLRVLLAAASFLRLGDGGRVWSQLRPHDAPYAILGRPVLHCVELLRTQRSELRVVARPDRSAYCLDIQLTRGGPSPSDA